MTSDTRIHPERRHTLYFLEEIRAIAPIFIDTEVDMGCVREHRTAAQRQGQHFSYITYVLHAAGQTLAGHPEANAAVRGRSWPRVARYGAVNGKITLDRTMNGHRVVLSAVIRDLDHATLAEIQNSLDVYRNGDPQTMPEFARIRMLDRLPMPLGRIVYRMGIRSLRRRPLLMGTIAVTSLGHGAVDSFHSVGGATITLGMGRTIDRPVVRAGTLAIAPVMRLSLAFDHRVIDGAEASDVLTELKDRLESFPAETSFTSSAASGQISL